MPIRTRHAPLDVSQGEFARLLGWVHDQRDKVDDVMGDAVANGRVGKRSGATKELGIVGEQAQQLPRLRCDAADRLFQEIKRAVDAPDQPAQGVRNKRTRSGQ